MEKIVYDKLLYVQSKLKAPKSQRNNFGNYNYRNCEDILEAVKPILEEIKSIIVLTDEIVLIGERYYIKATARFIDSVSGEEINNNAYAREEETKKGMDGSQITGSSSSYARKYALNGLLAIDDTKDSDTTNTGNDDVKIDTLKVSENVKKQVEDIGGSLEKVAQYYKCKVTELTDEMCLRIVNAKKIKINDKEIKV